MTKINVSAIIFVFNEMRYLEECLRSLSKCIEILVYDMGSEDGSLIIAEKYATKVISVPRVDIVESIWVEAISEANNDWIILLDPDEVFPTKVLSEFNNITQGKPEVAMISVPWKYYFLSQPLNSTTWGREHYKSRFFNRTNVKISGLLFDGIKLKPGYKTITIHYGPDNIIQHYWVESIQQLFSKHWRYIKNAGEARFKNGERFSVKRQFTDSVRSLKKNLFEYNGINDGWRGVFLSLFYTGFIFSCHISLYCYQKFQAPK
ncbi:glycosyltransferase [Chloroflexota bacterium]